MCTLVFLRLIKAPTQHVEYTVCASELAPVNGDQIVDCLLERRRRRTDRRWWSLALLACRSSTGVSLLIKPLVQHVRQLDHRFISSELPSASYLLMSVRKSKLALFGLGLDNQRARSSTYSLHIKHNIHSLFFTS